MNCVACSNNEAWHRRQVIELENTFGPRTALEFEQEHYEDEDDEFFDEDEYISRQSLMIASERNPDLAFSPYSEEW